MSKKENLKTEDLFEVIDQLNNYDDRTLVIVGSAFVESSLTDLIEKNLNKSTSTTKILSFTFCNKIELANSMSLISDREYNDLNCLRNLRNKFAHLILIKSIDHKESKQIIRNLTFCNMETYRNNSRDLIKITIVTLGIGLLLRNSKFSIEEIESDVYDGFKSFTEGLGNVILNLNKWGRKLIESFDLRNIK